MAVEIIPNNTPYCQFSIKRRKKRKRNDENTKETCSESTFRSANPITDSDSRSHPRWRRSCHAERGKIIIRGSSRREFPRRSERMMNGTAREITFVPLQPSWKRLTSDGWINFDVDRWLSFPPLVKSRLFHKFIRNSRYSIIGIDVLHLVEKGREAGLEGANFRIIVRSPPSY